jgi:hypothetical protein
MSVTSEIIKTQTAGDGVTTRYYFTFTIYENADLSVWVINNTTGNRAELTLNSDYTVSVNGKYIDLTSGALCPTGSTLNLTSDIAYLQGTELQDGGNWPSSVFNFVFDKLTILILQVKETIVNFVTLADVKEDSDIASAISLKHANTLDHTQNSDTAFGAQSADLNMNSHKITGLSAPASAGDSIRQTGRITEALLETVVTGPGTNTDLKIPQWEGANSKALKDGLTVVTSVGSPGDDVSVPTQKAVRLAITNAGGGDVSGPASSTDGELVAFDGTSGKLIKAYPTNLLNTVYPIGCIYTEITGTNPADTFGFGTWEAFGAGKTLVGLDAAQTEFDTVEETGGEKTHTLSIAELASHHHSVRVQWTDSCEINTLAVGEAAVIATGVTGNLGVDREGSFTGDTGSGAAHNNLQPYIVVYFWKRVE